MIRLQRFVVGVDARCGVHGSTGLFDLTLCSLCNLPPGSQGPGPSQMDRMSSCDGSRGGQPSLCLALPCSIAPRSCSTSGGSALCMRPATPFRFTRDGASSLCPPCRSVLHDTSCDSQ